MTLSQAELTMGSLSGPSRAGLTPLPEPSGLVLQGAGLLGTLGARWLRRGRARDEVAHV